jgi:RNA polymerase sigma factor (sigma-70 family)
MGGVGTIETGPSTDARLVERSVDRPEEFSAIFERHFAAIHRFLARRVGNVRADDLAAQTFLTAFERRARFDPAADSARPWLFGIAVNLMHNDRRAERRLLRALMRLDATTERDPVGELELVPARLDASRDSARVASALLALDQDQRDVLLLHAWADLSYPEIASALEIPVGTVRSRLSRIRETLSTVLDEPSTPSEKEHS